MPLGAYVQIGMLGVFQGVGICKPGKAGGESLPFFDIVNFPVIHIINFRMLSGIKINKSLVGHKGLSSSLMFM